MKVELREAIIARFEDAVIYAGAESYDKGMQQFGRLLEFLNRAFDPIRSKEQLRTLFDQMPEPSLLERRLIFGTMRYLPQILRFGLKQLSMTAEITLPKAPTGRPGMGLQEKVRIVDFVGSQHKHVISLDRCMKDAAKRFRVSEATVQRAWDDRTNLDDADFRSALKFLADGPRKD